VGQLVSVVLPSTREVAWHEAGHVAAQLCFGRLPREARVDWPDERTLGRTAVDWASGVDRDSADAVLISTLMGPLGDSTPNWPPDWPIDPAAVAIGAQHDAEQAKTLAEYLKLDAVGWSWVCYRAARLSRDRRFRRLVVAIANELERVEVLDADAIAQLAELQPTTENRKDDAAQAT
jgi:hypothetical protein